MLPVGDGGFQKDRGNGEGGQGKVVAEKLSAAREIWAVRGFLALLGMTSLSAVPQKVYP